MAALTAEALWIQETWRLRCVPLHDLDIQRRRNGKELALTLGLGPAAETLVLTFASAAQGERWGREIEARQRQLISAAPPDGQQPPDGVALVRQAPEVPHIVLGRVSFTGPTPWAADRGLQLRAGMRGADAIIDVQRQRCPELGWGARHVTGVAVRVADADAGKRLRLRWYAEEVSALFNRLLLLLVLQAALLFTAAAFCAGVSHLEAPTGETPKEALASAGLAIGLLYTWPVALLALLRVLRWPQLLRTVGLAALAVTTGRGLTVWVGHLAAVGVSGVPAAEGKLWMLADPVDWAFVIVGVVLCVRAWRLAREARQILPPEVQAPPTGRKVWSRGLLAVTGVYALVLLPFIGVSRYETSAHVIQPGVDTRREHEALLALNEGAAQANRGELASAERSFQRALRLWEELTERRQAPSIYRRNLAMTLHDLGWLRERQGRLDEAQQYYARAVAVADELADDPHLDDQFKEAMSGARQTLADLRAGKSAILLKEKDWTAGRKYEKAQVKAAKGEAGAERLYREAIALWEEVLPQADNEDYRKSALAQLALAHLRLGELQEQLGQRPAAEASLKKAIEYGEKAVALDPDWPVPRHNLEVARQRLEGLREQAIQDELKELCRAERFADAVDLCVRGIEEQEERVRQGKDRDAAVRRLACRLDRFAWFLAHCPDERVRDTKEAVKHARRATTLQPDVGDYWYTRATVEYRNGDWQGSLASLAKVKDREDGLDASGWFLSAMNLHQLKRREEARAAFRKGVEWIDEKKRQAENNAQLRLQFELMRPAIEALQREAENLLKGKDPANQAVG
ncbi:MAG TPA: tetratricopeptide repeat protein [Gemmataceae bacterium]|nr:tetratricopeptide repeat protein [Gemmataceae bacterium]